MCGLSKPHVLRWYVCWNIDWYIENYLVDQKYPLAKATNWEYVASNQKGMFRKEWLAISISKEIQLFCFGEIAVNLNQLYDQFFLANTVKKEARLFVQLKMERWETGLWCPEKCCLCSQKATSLLLTTLTEETVLASSGALYTKRREFRDLLLWWPSFIECEMGMQVSCHRKKTWPLL